MDRPRAQHIGKPINGLSNSVYGGLPDRKIAHHFN